MAAIEPTASLSLRFLLDIRTERALAHFSQSFPTMSGPLVSVAHCGQYGHTVGKSGCTVSFFPDPSSLGAYYSNAEYAGRILRYATSVLKMCSMVKKKTRPQCNLALGGRKQE
jgi:hypothetical protein